MNRLLVIDDLMRVFASPERILIKTLPKIGKKLHTSCVVLKAEDGATIRQNLSSLPTMGEAPYFTHLFDNVTQQYTSRNPTGHDFNN
jgi:hypothetical protein